MTLRKMAFAMIVAAAAIPAGVAAQHEHESDEGAQAEAGMMEGAAMCHQGESSMMGEGRGSMMGEGRGSMMGGDRGSMMETKVSTILRQKDALDLTEGQVEGLEAVQQGLAQRHEAHMEDMKALAARRGEILGEDLPDLEDLESVLSDEAGERVQMHMFKARSDREALQLLNEEQRSNLRYARRLMHNGMRGMKGSGSAGHH